MNMTMTRHSVNASFGFRFSPASYDHDSMAGLGYDGINKIKITTGT
jgi:hypothetical protein